MRKPRVFLTLAAVEDIRKSKETSIVLGARWGVTPAAIRQYKNKGHKSRYLYLEEQVEIANDPRSSYQIAEDWGISIWTVYRCRSKHGKNRTDRGSLGGAGRTPPDAICGSGGS